MKSLYFCIPVILGLVIPLQAMWNASLSQQLQHPLFGAMTNFSLAALLCLLAILIFRVPLPSILSIKNVPIYTFLGGLVGMGYVVSSILIMPKLGNLTFFSIIIAVQLSAALFYDHFGVMGFERIAISPMRLFGLILLLSGATLLIYSNPLSSISK